MYRLSKLIEIENKIKKIMFRRLEWTDHEILPLIEAFDSAELFDSTEARKQFLILQTELKKINAAIEKLEEIHHAYINELKKQKKVAHQNLLKKTSSHNHNYHLVFEKPEYYLNHRSSWTTTPSMYDEVKSVIGQYVTWKYPVIYYEPNTGDITNILVAGDPFYIIEDHDLIAKKFIEKFPIESHSKIHHYTKEQVGSHLEKECANLTVNWKNFAFKTPIEIRRDLKKMSLLTRPGGYVMFDYADSERFEGAMATDDGLVKYMWREKMLEWLDENNLDVLHEINFINNPLSVIVAKKRGSIEDLKLVNKIGLVLPNKEVFNRKRGAENELRRYYKSLTSKLEDDLKKIKERDVLLNELEEKRRVNTKIITEQKLRTGLNNLDIVTRKYPADHPAVLEAVLNVSKLTYNLGRLKDARNLIRRTANDVKKLDDGDKLKIEYGIWVRFLEGNC
jgi:hypothetical protein